MENRDILILREFIDPKFYCRETLRHQKTIKNLKLNNKTLNRIND